MNEPSGSMLVLDTDIDEGDNVTASASITGDEAERSLREQLKKSLHKPEASGATLRASKGKGKEREGVSELDMRSAVVETYPARQYFVLTDAGKPVFISRQEDEESDQFTSVIGLMQALISVFIDDGDKLRCINTGGTRITFLMRSPLYYACVSSWGEPESVILSIVSAEQLRRMFQRRNNFDLRRLLGGAEPLLFSLLDRLEFDLAMSTSSLHCLKLEPGLRKAIAESLVPTTKIKDILYVVMIAQGRVITLVRPRKHSIHPSDLHILINTVHSPSIINASAAASFLPICLPKFNQQAFVNAYITFPRRDDSAPVTPAPSGELVASEGGADRQTVSEAEQSHAAEEPDSTPSTPRQEPESKTEITLVCVCGLTELEAVRGWCATVSEKLERDGMMQALVDSIAEGRSEYSVGDLSIPGLRHFLYKSRPQVQVTMPTFEDPYDDLNEKRRLVTLYQTLHDNIHAKSGQESTLKLQCLRTERESVMGWITQPFELYLAMSPLLPKSALVNAANAIAKWVKREEKRLFLRDAPVF
ncbi:hypothetical protein EIP86_003695 [Pleurotus ostreatoroseus]|nr:hypothetical protein EIP86_003695 [Pleurotus ostreatoroseus]